MGSTQNMQPIKIVVIAGIRSQFMKLAALQKSIDDWNLDNQPKIAATYINSGQHYDDGLAGVFIRELDVRFDLDLTNKYKNNQPISIFSEMILALYNYLPETRADWVLVFGDANTTLAGAIAASKRNIPIIHVESGVRTGDRNSPEEINRILTDHMAAVHFLSSKKDAENLRAEGITNKIIWTGDLIGDLVERLMPVLPPCPLGYSTGGYVFASLHREENLKDEQILVNILNGLNNYSKKVLFITHPRTRIKCEQLGLYRSLTNIDFVNVLSYKQTLSAIKNCAFLVTDSGAFQREAYYLRKHCLVRQNHAFWKILTENGIHREIGQTSDDLSRGIAWIESEVAKNAYKLIDDLGDGNAGNRIIRSIIDLNDLAFSL